MGSITFTSFDRFRQRRTPLKENNDTVHMCSDGSSFTDPNQRIYPPEVISNSIRDGSRPRAPEASPGIEKELHFLRR